MLETVDLKKSVEKEEYKEEIEKLKQKLAALQRTIKEKKIPVIVLFEGWGGAGKGLCCQINFNFGSQRF